MSTFHGPANCHTGMDDATKILELFQLELLDSDQQLAFQNLHPEQDTFAFFQMLPLEIRRLIWQKSLPRRRFVSLGSSVCSAFRGRLLICKKKVQKRVPKHPVLLHVNQESRGVTLEHYTMIPTVHRCVHGTSPKYILRPLYIDPKVDLVSITMWSMFDRPKKHPKIFQYYSQYEQFFDKIHTLEIRDFRCCGPSEVWYQSFCHADGGFLNHFHGLREFHLVEPGDESWETYRSIWGLYRHKNSGIEILKQWFDKNKGSHPPQAHRSVPEFIFHAFRRAGPR